MSAYRWWIVSFNLPPSGRPQQACQSIQFVSLMTTTLFTQRKRLNLFRSLEIYRQAHHVKMFLLFGGFFCFALLRFYEWRGYLRIEIGNQDFSVRDSSVATLLSVHTRGRAYFRDFVLRE